MNGGLPLMGAPLGLTIPRGLSQQPRQVVNNDRPVAATPGRRIAGDRRLDADVLSQGATAQREPVTVP